MGEGDPNFLSEADESTASELLSSLLREEEELSLLQHDLREACASYIRSHAEDDEKEEYNDEDQNDDEEEYKDEDEMKMDNEQEQEQEQEQEGASVVSVDDAPTFVVVSVAKCFHHWGGYTDRMQDARRYANDRCRAHASGLQASLFAEWKGEIQEIERLRRLSNFFEKQRNRDVARFFFFSWILVKEESKSHAVCKQTEKVSAEVQIALCNDFGLEDLIGPGFDANEDVNVLLENDLNDVSDETSEDGTNDDEKNLENVKLESESSEEITNDTRQHVKDNNRLDVNDDKERVLTSGDVEMVHQKISNEAPLDEISRETHDDCKDVNVNTDEDVINDMSVLSEAGWSQVDFDGVLMDKQEELLKMMRKMQSELRKKDKIIEEQHFELKMFRRQSLDRLRCHNHIGEQDTSLVRAKLSM